MDKRKPKFLGALKLAPAQSLDEMLIGIVQKAIIGVANRAKLCIKAECAVFKGRNLAGDGSVDMDTHHQSEEEPGESDGRDEWMS